MKYGLLGLILASGGVFSAHAETMICGSGNAGDERNDVSVKLTGNRDSSVIEMDKASLKGKISVNFYPGGSDLYSIIVDLANKADGSQALYSKIITPAGRYQEIALTTRTGERFELSCVIRN